MTQSNRWPFASPACLLRSCEKREAEEGEEPFPRGKKRAAPLTVRKLSLMLDGDREKRKITVVLKFRWLYRRFLNSKIHYKQRHNKDTRKRQIIKPVPFFTWTFPAQLRSLAFVCFTGTDWDFSYSSLARHRPLRQSYLALPLSEQWSYVMEFRCLTHSLDFEIVVTVFWIAAKIRAGRDSSLKVEADEESESLFVSRRVGVNAGWVKLSKQFMSSHIHK